MKRIVCLGCLLLTVGALTAGEAKADEGNSLRLSSPDGTQEIVFWQEQVSPGVAQVLYRVN